MGFIIQKHELGFQSEKTNRGNANSYKDAEQKPHYKIMYTKED